jgi:CO/xanthine dehydrogenase Mo-binding subunit
VVFPARDPVGQLEDPRGKGPEDVAAEVLGVRRDAVEVRIGDNSLPEAMIAGGSHATGIRVRDLPIRLDKLLS